MPRRIMLTDRQRAALLDLPTDEASMLRHYTQADDDLKSSAPVAAPIIVSASPSSFACCDTLVGCWLHVFASIAQFERERISERTREGLASARKRG